MVGFIQNLQQSIRNGRKARFFNVLDLVNQLEQEKLDNRGGKLAEHLVRHDLVILVKDDVLEEIKRLRKL